MSDNPNALRLAEPDREPGDATRCINEVEKATLSPDVKIFMQAGGTYVWGHEKFRDLNAKIQTAIGYGKDPKTGAEFPIYFQNSNKVRVGKWFLKGGGGNTVAVPVQNGKLGRYVYDGYRRDWRLIEKLPITGDKNSQTDMGSK